MVAQAFEDLAQAFRVLLEARVRAVELFEIDFCEAVGNIEAAMTGILNCFASLYDAMQKEGIQSRVDWYGTPPLCMILALRNARHHNVCSKIRTLFRYHLDFVSPAEEHRNYLMVDFESQEEDAMTLDVPVSLGDFIDLLDLPIKTSRLRATVKPLIESYLNIPDISAGAVKSGLTIRETFFNVVPLLVNAGIAIHPHIADRIRHQSMEAAYFDSHFKDVLPCLPHRHTFRPFAFGKT